MKMGYNMSEMRDEEEIRELVRWMSEAELQSMEQDETLREPAEFSEMFHRRMERISLLWYSEKDKLAFLLLGTDSTEEELFRVKDGIREKEKAEWEAPSSYREEVSDNLSFDAEVVVSDSFRNGIFYKTRGQYQAYDEDAAFEMFFGEKEIEDRITYEMPDRSGAEKEGYAYQSEDGCSLCLYPAQVSYSVNAEADRYFYGFCDTVGNTTMYNAGSYSLTEELDFMTRDETKRKVQETLEGIGFFPGEFTCQAYALDAPTLCEESRRVYEWGFEEGDVDFRTEWGKEQEAYAFRIWQVCQGLPVWTAEIGPLYVADESRAPVTGIYRKDGLVSLTVTDILNFETSEEYEVLLPFQELVGKISESYQDGEYEGKVTIKEIRLCALTIGEEGGACIVAPVWICTGEQAEDGYPVQRTFDAVTGEEIGGN